MTTLIVLLLFIMVVECSWHFPLKKMDCGWTDLSWKPEIMTASGVSPVFNIRYSHDSIPVLCNGCDSIVNCEINTSGERIFNLMRGYHPRGCRNQGHLPRKASCPVPQFSAARASPKSNSQVRLHESPYFLFPLWMVLLCLQSVQL